MLVYHGTTAEVGYLIEEAGLVKQRPMSFHYVTTDLAQAEWYACDRAEQRYDMPVVVVLEIPDDEIEDGESWSEGVAPGHFLTANDQPATRVVDIWVAEETSRISCNPHQVEVD